MDPPLPKRAETTTSRPPRSRPRAIVVVEGEPLLADLIRDSFGGSGFDVVRTGTVDAALRELQAASSVVAVVDDDLPLLRGMDVVGRLRAERADVEVVLTTRDEALAAFAVRLNVERLQCLKKPLQLEDLRNSVAHAIERVIRRERASTSGFRVSERVANGHEVAEGALPPTEKRTTGAPSAPPPGRDGGEGLRVLVVDDDPLVRRSMARTFRRHRVTTAENGRAAAAEIERSKPDVIISDLKMPEMDGFQLAEEIRERWPDLANRIVFVSGTSSQIERAKTEAPTQPLVTKPVNSQELEARMAEVLEAATRRR